jgi:hypothetical protein
MTMVQYFGYDSELQTAVHVYVIHNGSTCVCADDHDLVDNLSLMQVKGCLLIFKSNIYFEFIPR